MQISFRSSLFFLPIFASSVSGSFDRVDREKSLESVEAEQLLESVNHNERPSKLANRWTKIGSRPEESLSFRDPRGSREIQLS